MQLVKAQRGMALGCTRGGSGGGGVYRAAGAAPAVGPLLQRINAHRMPVHGSAISSSSAAASASAAQPWPCMQQRRERQRRL